jgi:acetyl esterase/lipase
LQNRGFIIGGNSAGGLLASVVAFRARDRCLSPSLTGLLLRAPLLIHPKIAHKLPGEGIHSLSDDIKYPYHQRGDAELLFDLYEVPEELWADPTVSPLMNTDFRNLPPAHFQICELDPHRDEAYRFSQRIDAAGGQTRLDVYQGMPHAFWMLPRLKGAADSARDACLGLDWMTRTKCWDTGMRKRIMADTSAWVLKASKAEGERAWQARKLCNVKGCACFF